MAAQPPDPGARYPIRNDNELEERRLARLQELYDPDTIRRLETIGVAPGWDCAELGGGRGSIAAWLSDRVGEQGSVAAIDRDTSQLTWLADRPNVNVLQADLMTLEFPEEAFDLVHSRAVLMHLPDPRPVVERAVRSLRPGGWVLFEEADGRPAAEATGLHPSYERTLVPIAVRWNTARGLAAQLRSLGMEEVTDDVGDAALAGATPRSEFWKHTLATVRQLRRGDEDFGAAADEVAGMLDDPAFSAPLLEHHAVFARRPPPAD